MTKVKHGRLSGDKAEAIAINYFIQNDHIVSNPINHSTFYDIIIDNKKNKKALKVEVKSSSTNIISLTNRMGRNRTRKMDCSKCDLVFMVAYNKDVYIFDSKDVHGLTKIRVNKEMPQYIITIGD